MDLKRAMHRFRPLRTAGRFGEIAGILIKYGFGSLVEQLGLPGGAMIQRLTKVDEKMPVNRRIRMAIEELGPTFIKFGQIISLRPDLVPKALAEELSNLHEDVQHESFEDIKKVVEGSLGKPMAGVFKYFNREPIAAGSLAQVHSAVLLADDSKVAVKVLRPDIHDTIHSDLELLETVTNLMHERVDMLKEYDLPGVVAEIKRTLSREVNLLNEAQNMALVRENFKDREKVFIPAVYPELTTDAVLTMDLVDGKHIREVSGDDEYLHELALRGMNAALNQIMDDGLFHADPHPGNIRILDDGTLCLLDWGMVGRLTEDMRGLLISFFMAVVKKNPVKLVDSIRDMSSKVPPRLDDEGLQKELLYLLDRIHNPAHVHVEVSDLLIEIVNLCREYGIKVRPDFVYMMRALLASEATGKTLYPDFDIMGELAPVSMRYMARRYAHLLAPSTVAEKIEGLIRMAAQAPERVQRFFALVEAGELSIQFNHRNLEGLRETIRTFGKRIASALITAALIIGSSMIVSGNVGPKWGDMPVIGVLGYILSAVFGIWLVFSMLFGKK